MAMFYEVSAMADTMGTNTSSMRTINYLSFIRKLNCSL